MRSSIRSLRKYPSTSCSTPTSCQLHVSSRNHLTQQCAPRFRKSRLISMSSPTPPSTPTTPSAENPSNPSSYRFEHIAAPTEWVEAYRPTGYHPIHFGDMLHDGRYRIIHKLGYGAFSTVWLANDSRYCRALLTIPIPSYCLRGHTFEVRMHILADSH